MPPSDPGTMPHPGHSPWAVTAALPGLAASGALATLGFAVWAMAGFAPSVSPMIVALLGGLLLGNVTSVRGRLAAGSAIAMRPVLRAGIVLLGFRLTLADLGALGLSGLAAIVLVVTVTFFVIRRAGRALGVSGPLSDLIAAGTSICGASAIMGMKTVTRARDEEVAYAIACVTVFGTLSMLIFPTIMPVLEVDARAYGMWAGISIHEVAQAVGAGWAAGPAAGEAATITKLGRVLLLAPMILGMGLIGRGGGDTRPGMAPPYFVMLFLLAIVVNTLVGLPDGLQSVITLASTFMLAMALGAMGVETRMASIRKEGLAPLLLGAFGWLFISSFGAVLVFLISGTG